MSFSERLRQLREQSAPSARITGRQVVRARKSIPRRRKAGPRRGDEHDRDYLEWMSQTQSCYVAGRRSDSPCWGVGTNHHLRHIRHEDGTIERTGRIDRRTVRLCEGHHLHGHPHAIHTMTGDFGAEWERFFDIDTEAAIRRYNAEYEARP